MIKFLLGFISGVVTILGLFYWLFYIEEQNYYKGEPMPGETYRNDR